MSAVFIGYICVNITAKMDIDVEWTGAWVDEQRQHIDGRKRDCARARVCVCVCVCVCV
jgi:hypothetical protein